MLFRGIRLVTPRRFWSRIWTHHCLLHPLPRYSVPPCTLILLHTAGITSDRVNSRCGLDPIAKCPENAIACTRPSSIVPTPYIAFRKTPFREGARLVDYGSVNGCRRCVPDVVKSLYVSGIGKSRMNFFLLFHLLTSPMHRIFLVVIAHGVGETCYAFRERFRNFALIPKICALFFMVACRSSSRL